VRPEHPLSPDDAKRLDELHSRLARHTESYVGYPSSSRFDYAPLHRFLSFPANNIGDPFAEGQYAVNTHEFEREVVRAFAEFAGGRPGETWGYCTNGGTEGNMYGVFLARELLPDGVVYFSEDTHYSASKILRFLHLRHLMIKSRPDGTMDLDDFRATVRINRDAPPIVFANIGTTMKGAVDDVPGILGVLDDLGVEKRYLHADAALSGTILPFLDDAPPWDFAAGADSVAVSGHKMIGAPIPCGVALARKRHVDRIARLVEYIGTLDTTLSGSRSAIAPLFLWYALRTIGADGIRRQVAECLRVAEYAVRRFREVGWSAWRHWYSNTVVLDRPSDALSKRWQLATQGKIAHVVAMPQVTTERIDRLAEELYAERKGGPSP
jgi:histidine decarboxylase